MVQGIYPIEDPENFLAELHDELALDMEKKKVLSKQKDKPSKIDGRQQKVGQGLTGKETKTLTKAGKASDVKVD